MQGFVCRSAGWGARTVFCKSEEGRWELQSLGLRVCQEGGSEMDCRVQQCVPESLAEHLQGAGQQKTYLQTWLQQLAPSHYIKSCMQTARDRTRLGNYPGQCPVAALTPMVLSFPSAQVQGEWLERKFNVPEPLQPWQRRS